MGKKGKKDKKSNASAPISSTLKAVPVALMLAMSPMVTQAQRLSAKVMQKLSSTSVICPHSTRISTAIS